MRFLSLLMLAIVIQVTAAPASAIDYWPDDPNGLVYHFSSTAFGEMIAEYTVDGTQQIFQFTTATCYGNHELRVSAKAVSMISQITMCAGWIDPDFSYMDPALDLVREGMADGDAWVVTYGSSLVFVFVTEETIVVPLGEFRTLHVQIQSLGWPFFAFPDWWLERSLGPVKIGDWELSSVEGTVPTTPSTWSELKAYFR